MWRHGLPCDKAIWTGPPLHCHSEALPYMGIKRMVRPYWSIRTRLFCPNLTRSIARKTRRVAIKRAMLAGAHGDSDSSLGLLASFPDLEIMSHAYTSLPSAATSDAASILLIICQNTRTNYFNQWHFWQNMTTLVKYDILDYFYCFFDVPFN